MISYTYNWFFIELWGNIKAWFEHMQQRLRIAKESSSWWNFLWDWKKSLVMWLWAFKQGKHQFSPLIEYQFKDEIIRVWSYLDRLMLHLILKIIKPTFKYVISSLCFHLHGPSAIKNITQQIKYALATGKFNYCLRIDIKSYYASIDHKILLKQLFDNYNDPRLRYYFSAIVTTAIDCGGQIILPKKGIPLRSSLSPFFGALYLTALDRAFTNRPGIFYCRYMDDIIILVQNKRQYNKARKRLFTILRELKLTVSPRKTRMGELKQGFHFLGVSFAVAQTPQKQTQEVAIDIHKRSCRRALDKAVVMQEDAVNPANIQCYLSRWATWWKSVIQLEKIDLLYRWVSFVTKLKVKKKCDIMWVGRGLLLGSVYYSLDKVCESLPTAISNQNQLSLA